MHEFQQGILLCLQEKAGTADIVTGLLQVTEVNDCILL